MRKLIFGLTLFVFGLAGLSLLPPEPLGAVTFTSWCVDMSSNTTSLETTVRIPASGPGDILASVIVGSAAATSGQILLYDNVAGTTNLIANLETDSIRQVEFGVRISSAITYTTSGAAGSVTILWCDDNPSVAQ